MLNGFGVISNDNILRTYLCKDMIHLEDLGTNVLTGFLIQVFDKHSKGLYGNIGVLISDNSLSS